MNRYQLDILEQGMRVGVDTWLENWPGDLLDRFTAITRRLRELNT